MPLLSASDVAVHYGADVIFEGIDIEINERARIGLVGPNGGGKTSLLKVLVGELESNAGNVQRSRGLRITYVPQFPTTAATGTLKEEVMGAFDRVRWLEQALETGASDLNQSDAEQAQEAESRYAAWLLEYEGLGGYTYQNDLERMVDGLGLSQDTLSSSALTASGGERTRASLARALLGDPDLLVLDEPTNYLDLNGVTWLERYLTHYAPAVLVVSHDRYFLDQTVNQIWELDHFSLNTFTGNFTKYRLLKAEQVLRRQREYEEQQEYIAKEEAFIQRYRAGQRSREARGRETRLQRLERIARPDSDQAISLSSLNATRTGQVVLSSHTLKVGFVDGPSQIELLSVPDVELERGSRTAVIGDNGTGKTTLIKTILGQLPALEGQVALGHNVSVGYYRQGMDTLLDESTVLEAFLDAKNMPFEEARSYLARFLFRGDEVFQEVGSCSGGERSRLELARLLVKAPNLLILDEPTTHLDIASREALEQVLSKYDGTLLLVSHDRRLVSNLAESLWVVGGGAVTPFAGTFEAWQESESQTVKSPASPPKPRPARTSPRSEPAVKRRNPRAPVVDTMAVLVALEERLAEIEAELQAVAQTPDTTELARLGEEYDRTKAELDRKMEEWEE